MMVIAVKKTNSTGTCMEPADATLQVATFGILPRRAGSAGGLQVGEKSVHFLRCSSNKSNKNSRSIVLATLVSVVVGVLVIVEVEECRQLMVVISRLTPPGRIRPVAAIYGRIRRV